MKTKNPRMILQNCLPGVTIHDGHSYHPTEEQSISPQCYQYSYQSLHVVKDMDTSHFDWIQEQQNIHHQQEQQRRRKTLRAWFLSLAIIFMIFVTLYRSDSVSDTTMVTILHQQNDNIQKILHALERLDGQLEGSIVFQSTKQRYVNASRLWRQGVMSPLAIIEVKTQHDVVLAIPILAGLARDYDLEFTVRSGGYSPFVSTNGILLSLVHLQGLKWTNHSTIVLEPGVQVQNFQQQVLDRKGFTSVVADAAHVSLGGFLLGGGYGLLSRKYGMGMDNVVRLRVVLNNGFIQDVVPGDDLFWAILGSGGTNFGIVTEIEYKVYPTSDMKLTANVRLPIGDATNFLQKLGDIETMLDRNVVVRIHGLSTLPENLHDSDTIQNETSVLDGTTEITIYWMGDCNPENPVGMKYLKELVIPLIPTEMTDNIWFYYFSWSAMSRAKEQPASWSTIWAAQSWNGFLYAENNVPEVWSEIQQSLLVLFQYAQHVTPTIDLWGGAIADIANNMTTFPYRQGLYHIRLDLMVPTTINTTAAEAQKVYEQEVALVSAIWPSISKYLHGVFVNYPMPSLSQDEFPNSYWGNNLERLVQLKQQLDPLNVFHYDQSVPIPSD